MYFLWYLLVGLVSGWIANLIMKGKGATLLINLVVGVIGGFIGGRVLSLFGLIAEGTIGSLVTSVIGAVILLWFVSLFIREKE